MVVSGDRLVVTRFGANALIVSLLLISMSGCTYAELQANKQLDEYKQLLDSMIDTASREDVVRQFGAPEGRQVFVQR